MRPHPRVSLINLLFVELFKLIKRFFKWLFVIVILIACSPEKKQNKLEEAMVKHGQNLLLEKGISNKAGWSFYYDTLTAAGVITKQANQILWAAVHYCSLGPSQDTKACERLQNIRDSLLSVAAKADNRIPVAYYCRYALSDREKYWAIEYVTMPDMTLLRYKDFFKEDYGDAMLKKADGYNEYSYASGQK